MPYNEKQEDMRGTPKGSWGYNVAWDEEKSLLVWQNHKDSVHHS